MGDIALRGAELKKMVAMAKKRDLNFAYCPGNDPKEDVFVLDRKKKPEVIGRVARAEGTGTKLGAGTAKVKGKVMSLTCERELPQMSKKLKKFLKYENIAMNIIILDASGNVLEEDIEDLGDDGEDDAEASSEDVAQDGDDDASQDDAEQDAESNDDEDAAAQLRQLKARAAQIQTGIKDVQGDAQAPLVKGFKAGVGAMQGGNLESADEIFTKLEAAIDKLAGAPAPSASQNDAAENPALAKLAGVSAALSKRIDGLGNAAGVDKMRAAHGMLDTQIQDADVKKAATTAKALGDAITRLEGQAQETDSNTDANSDENADTAADAGDTYRDARADLEPVILDLVQRGLGDVGKMRAVLAYFTEKGDAEDYAGALKAVPGLKKLIAEAQAAEQSAAEKDIPQGVVPFVRARLEWIKTRNTLKAEMSKLQAEILKVCEGDDFPTIANDSKALFTYLEALDSRLEDALEALVQEPDGDRREALKANARKVLSDYQGELDAPFFQAVDSGNGFKPVNVRGAAIASLANVNAALTAAA